MTTERTGGFALPATAHPGRVALRVGSIDRVAPFYRDVLGAEVERDGERAWIEAGDATLVALREDHDAPERAPGEAGLFHLAIRVPDRGALGATLSRIRGSGASLTGASDHLVSEALYLRDPEGNGVEIYRDRPREEWPWREDGGVEMDTLPLDLDDLAAEDDGGDRLPAGTDIGHVHLEVTDLARAEGFYVDALGLGRRARYGEDASFLAAGDYHHHLGLNVWNGRSEPAGEGRGIAWFEFLLPDGGTASRLEGRLEERGYPARAYDGGIAVSDPDGIEVRLRVEGE